LFSGVPTLATVLRQHGFKTAAFNSNPFLSAGFGYARGFDVFEDGLLSKRASRLPRTAYTYLAKAVRLVRRTPYMPAPKLVRLAVRWMREECSESTPFFIWVHFMDTHGPYQPKRGIAYLNKVRAERLWRKAVTTPQAITSEERDALKEAYLEEVAFAERYIGVLLKEIESLGRTEDTIIVLCSDHGDGFNEHGFYSHPRYLYEELVRVPLLIYHPSLGERRIVQTPVGLVDIMPTVLDMLGIPPDGLDPVGQSLWPAILRGDTSSLRGWVVMDATPDRLQYIAAIRTNRWKLIVDREKGTRDLYDLVADPGEQNNVAHLYPDVVESLEAQLRDELEQREPLRTFAESPEPEVDAEVLGRLRDLGYIE